MTDSSTFHSPRRVAIVGGGPAGLMAAETLIRAAAGPESGLEVHVFEAKPSVGRKFLIAGKGGMNLSHSEPVEQFLTRYRERADVIAELFTRFGPEDLRNWSHELGIETFIGTSGRVFPHDMKAAPLLRAWLRRLRQQGTHFHVRHRWLDWQPGRNSGDPVVLKFANDNGEFSDQFEGVIFAMGGQSWSKLGSDGQWQTPIAGQGIDTRPLVPSNCGFEHLWSDHFKSRFAGSPVKSCGLVTQTSQRQGEQAKKGEFVISEFGVEGSLIYALSSSIRTELEQGGSSTLYLDLLPDRPEATVIRQLTKPRGSNSWSNHLRKRVGLTGVKAALLRELAPDLNTDDAQDIARKIKQLPLCIERPRPIEEAISSAGGVLFEQLDNRLMATQLPGVAFAGEMLDWEAPTGGYLFTACFSSGHSAATGMLDYLQSLTEK
ncbi:HI0933 family flavoprotein [Oleiphilus messinensis]|uniref:HI0933 family flavoprotein n=1 Tax=Oleiphilus messinensis TaxID=141451 RepID=A0A1Y0IFJ3_9GAMM|nr:TIGR03862 family flavoprotein [Oleiphilus messinensis]ARU59282.1 HI0933 family flavoprotein [Oleiphilus messinensis]